MSKVLAIETRAWNQYYFNHFPDCRDLGAVGTLVSGASVTYAKGLDGRPDSATVLTDDNSQSPNTYERWDSPTVSFLDYDYTVVRAYVLKDAANSVTSLFRAFQGSLPVWSYQFRADTGGLTLDPGSTNAVTYGSKATLRTIAGQEWWEIWIWGADPDAAGFHNGDNQRYLRVYPAAGSPTAAASITIGNIEMYSDGDAPDSSESPEVYSWGDLDGTPPNYGEFHWASKEFNSGWHGNQLNWDLDSLFSPLGNPQGYPRKGNPFVQYADRLLGGVSYSISIKPSPWGGTSAATFGTIEICNADGAYDDLIYHNWRDRYVNVWLHDTDEEFLEPFNDLIPTVIEGADTGAKLVFRAIVESFSASETTLKLVIRDAVPELYAPLNQSYPELSPNTYIDAVGRAAPISLGTPLNVKPVLINSSTNDYEVHDSTLPTAEGTGLSSTDTVYDDNSSISFTGETAGFSLSTASSGRVAADVTSTAAATISGITGELTARRPNITFDDAAILDTTLYHSSPQNEYNYGAYLQESTTPATVLNWMASTINGYWFVNRFGDIKIGQLRDPGFAMVNILIDSGASPYTDYGWENSANPVTITTGKRGVDGELTAVKLTDDNVDFESLRTPAFYADQDQKITYRVWVLKENLESPRDAPCAFRLLDTVSLAVFGRIATFRPDDGSYTTAATAPDDISVTQVTLGGQEWWEVVAEATCPAGNPTKLIIYPSGETAANQGDITVGGVEIYLGAELTDIRSKPPTLTLRKEISSWQIIGDIRVSDDLAPNLSNGMGADKNWSTGSEGGGLNADKFSRAYQYEYRSSSALHSNYSHAEEAQLPMSLHRDQEGAAAEADRICAVYQQKRAFYELTIGFDDPTKLLEYVDAIGTTFSVTADRFDLDQRSLMLVGVSGEISNNKINLTFWG